MKRFSEQLKIQSQTVKLTKAEQADLRDRVVSYMEYHPLPASMKTTAAPKTRAASTKSQILTDTFGQFAIPYQLLFKLGGVAAVFVLVFVPFMAERTVPGDTLYAVKVQFNEEVRSSLTWGSYEKVEWETTRLNRRIAEARLLADDGLLTQEIEESVAAAVKVHSDNAKREIEVLRIADADEALIATIAFESSLGVQAQAFSDDSATDQGEPGVARTGMLISDMIDQSRAAIPQTASTSVPAYNKLMARVELSTTRVRDLRDAIDGDVDAKDLADVTRRIEDIDRAILAAIELASDESTEFDARVALSEVIARTQRLIIFMTELQVREEVTLEEVVPVVLTADEQTIDRSTKMTALDTGIAAVTAAAAGLENEQLAAKLTETIAALQITRTELMVIDSYPEFVKQSQAALALVADSLILVEQSGATSPVDPVATTTPAIAVDLATSTQAVSTSTVQTDQATSTAQ